MSHLVRVAITALSFCAGATAIAAPAVDANQLKNIRNFAGLQLTNEANLSELGQKSFFDPAVPRPLPVAQVIADWKKNAIAANRKYSSSVTRIGFNVIRTSVSFNGAPTLSTQVPRDRAPDEVNFEFAKATEKEIDELAALKEGSKFQAVCGGKINVIGNPGGPDVPGLAGSVLTFHDCHTTHHAVGDVYSWFDKALDAWYEGKVTKSLSDSPGYKAMLPLLAGAYDAVMTIPEECLEYVELPRQNQTPPSCRPAFNKWMQLPLSAAGIQFAESR
jgi:hypothetical protein